MYAAGVGETADLGEGLTVRPLELIEDSRCPANVACVWAGRLRLRADVSGMERELTLGEPLETPHGALLFAVASPSAFAQWPEHEIARRLSLRLSPGLKRAPRSSSLSSSAAAAS